tara:strand:- start:3576 stop:4127 length:552 start_codon:yes stop_codon:yes gene_type:complete
MSSIEKATLAAGCFWCIEAVFELVEGVDRVVSGYIGGTIKNPSYEEICTGTTGHAEAIEVYYDQTVLDYQTVLEIFFSYHDPTTLNRQGADVGTQYRSAIFYHNDTQKKFAEQSIKYLNDEKVFPDPIVTEVTDASKFYKGENYHQSFFKNNPYQPYCQFIIAPKVMKLREKHAHLLKIAQPH